MGKFIGRLCNVGIGKESPRGTAAAAAFWIPKVVFAFDDKVEKVRSALSYGNIGGFGNQSLVAQKWAEGSLEGDIFDKSFGLLLLAALGTVSSAVFSGAYKHTYSLQNDNQHDSLTIRVDEPAGDLCFELAMIDKLELTIVPNDVVKFAAAFKARNSATSSEAATFAAANKFLGRHLSFKLGALTTDLDSAAAISLNSLKLTISKNLILDQVCGTIQPEDILNKQFVITGELELAMQDRTYANYMLDGSYKAARIDLVAADITIGTTNPSFRLDLSRVDFDAWEPDRKNDDIVMQKITFTALYDLTNGNIINNCYLINETASY